MDRILLLTGVPAVGADQRPGHERTIIRQQEQNHLADLLGRSESLDRLGRSQHFIDLLGGRDTHLMESFYRRSNHRAVDGAGTDAVHSYIIWSVVYCAALGELAQSCLAHPIHRAATLADKHLVRSHENNIAV